MKFTNVDATNRKYLSDAILQMKDAKRGAWKLVRAYNKVPDLAKLQRAHNARNKKLSNVKPICLPWNVNDPGRRIYDGNKLTVLGWGKVTNDKDTARNTKRRLGAGSAILQKLEVPAISRRKCKEFDSFKNYDLNSSSQLCAGGVHG